MIFLRLFEAASRSFFRYVHVRRCSPTEKSTPHRHPESSQDPIATGSWSEHLPHQMLKTAKDEEQGWSEFLCGEGWWEACAVVQHTSTAFPVDAGLQPPFKILDKLHALPNLATCTAAKARTEIAHFYIDHSLHTANVLCNAAKIQSMHAQ